ncbi:MAG: DUF4149 domain-containing protein [Cyanobacteria bacterium SID2]|nr:DUF4149 domain-containing protein [Cyanobacteria bacterium SID2]MBP0005816.1 DUF4149 domain-containing protein [Cyanobacteria bacterium SBC]
MTAFTSWVRQRPSWPAVVSFILSLWFGGSLILDFVVMPSLYSAGMMTEPGFASAGYLTFERFNHIELIFAGVALTGVLVLNYTRHFFGTQTRKAIILSILLLGVALTYTYFFTPQMSALGIQLDALEPAVEIPKAMASMHQGYWILEILKLVSVWLLMRLCCSRPTVQNA